MCEKKFGQKSGLLSHKKTVHEESLQHQKTVHEGRKDFACDRCEKQFGLKWILLVHQKTVHEGRKDFACDKCEKKFTLKCNLIVHQKTVHEGRKDFACDKCKKKFATKTNLLVHQKAFHDSRKDFECDKCEKKFAQKSSLITHQKIVHEGRKDFVCDKCEKVFGRKPHFLQHQKTVHEVHEGQKDYVCEKCEKAFGQKLDLLKHQQTVHEGRKDFACGNCQKKFGQNSHLLLHQKTIHEGRKDFPCDKCEKKFGDGKNLNTHQRTVHEGRKDFVCNKCERKFGLKQHLLNHQMTVHDNRKDYPCDKCEKKFGKKSNLISHQKTIHEGRKDYFECDKVWIKIYGVELVKTREGDRTANPHVFVCLRQPTVVISRLLIYLILVQEIKRLIADSAKGILSTEYDDRLEEYQRFMVFAILVGCNEGGLEFDEVALLRLLTNSYDGHDFDIDDPWVTRCLFDIHVKFDANYFDKEYRTENFYLACKFARHDVVKKFLELGQDPNCRCRNTGDSPLHLLTFWILDDDVAQTIELLLRNGANPNAANLRGSTPLHKLCGNIYLNHIDIIERFLVVCDDVQQEVHIDARDKKGRTPLHLAMDYGRNEVVELLLRRGADPNARDAKGTTPLHLIMYWPGHNKSFKTILRHGADPNLANEDGRTPLHDICERDHNDELVQILFEICDERQLTVQVNTRDKSGKTPLQLAVANLLPNTVDMLLNRGADMSNCLFPTSIDTKLRIDSSLICKMRVASGALAVAEHLEARGYHFSRSDALTIVNYFVKHELFEKSSSDLEKSLRDDQEFAGNAKKAMIVPSLSLYDLIHLGPEEEEKLLTYRDYFVFAHQYYKLLGRQRRYEILFLHLCEKLSRGFFRRWALDPFYELFHKRLPILCCEMVLEELNNQDLCNICLCAVCTMAEDDQELFSKLKIMRKSVNWKVEEERRVFLHQLYPIIGHRYLDRRVFCPNEVLNHRDIFRREEIDWLLIEDVKNNYKRNFCGSLVECFVSTGYKDEPNVDADGKPSSCRTTPIHHAAGLDRRYHVDDLFKIYDRFDVNYIDDSGLTHFHVACFHNLNGVVEKFLEFGQDPNYLSQRTDDTPLHLAVTNKNEEMALLLHQSGSRIAAKNNPNLANEDGLTHLHFICMRTQEDDFLEFLFKIVDDKYQPMEVDARDKKGRTPLEHAVTHLLPNTVDLLLDHAERELVQLIATLSVFSLTSFQVQISQLTCQHNPISRVNTRVSILGLERPQQVSDFSTSILQSFEKDVLPSRFGIRACSRQFLITQTAPVARELHDISDDQLALVCDGTYLRHEKSSNNEYQRKSYSGQKKAPLCKPFTICTTNGYIVDVLGPYNATENDAKILESILNDPEGLTTLLRDGDKFFLDRGFRDVIAKLLEL
ncbi:unnamed protein product, partial [Trichogramma brassicae]